MKTRKVIALVVVASLVFFATGFATATFHQRNLATPFGEMPGPAGAGPMGDLSDEDRAALESMTEEERRVFLEEGLGGRAPASGGGGPARGGTLEGEVVEATGETITLELANGGSQTVYTSADTVISTANDAETLAPGANVTIIAQPAADGVTSAEFVIIR